ncbi:asparaginase [Alteripontixanthobacter maritimus]|nr:asparaginase [Alteripontixanthobacter maritimus]
MISPYIHVCATGGTIAGRAGSPTRRDYRPGQIGIEHFLTRISALGIDTVLTGEQIANVGSEDIGLPVWAALHSAVQSALADDDCAGVIVTHGTDTAEETAFLLDQTLPTDKPVVLVGAMRPDDAVGSDGLRNFANAVRVASNPDASGRGVLVVMGDLVHSARDVRKAVTTGTSAFRSFPRSPIAAATPGSLEWFTDPWRTGEGARHPLPKTMPDVAVLYAVAGMSASAVTSAIAGGAQGVVLAGFGEGNAPAAVREALGDAAKAGVPVVRSSRVDEALVDREPDDDRLGLVAARALGPAKSRILLQLLLAQGITNFDAIQAEFGRR